MHLLLLLVTSLFINSSKQNIENGYCEIDAKSCDSEASFDQRKYIFYDVNPAEGFNLRRDVYMRFAIMLADAQKIGKRLNWNLVLPPWYRLYHWQSSKYKSRQFSWRNFFDLESLKSFAPVTEMDEVLPKNRETFLIDTVYVLQNYPNPFEGGTFAEKWEITDENCDYEGFWGYSNIKAKEVLCVKFQGKISMLWELIDQHPKDKYIMFHHGEIPLHDNYGTKSFWSCRKSMKFSRELHNTAYKYMEKHLNCSENEKCNYISVHWRRQDFAMSRQNDVPSLFGTVKQINKFVQKTDKSISKIYIATDAKKTEFEQLKNELSKLNYEVYNYVPSKSEIDDFGDGGIAIVDQIICSHAAYFIGTHESTFTFRIQEEREILGHKSVTTFNRLCPDSGKCEKASKWTIVD